MSPAALEVAGLGAAPGGAPVLHEVDLSVPAGSLTTVVGPSGAGKTTLLRVLAGLEEATAGSVHVGGRDVTGVPAATRPVAMVFQDARLFPSLDVAGNVAFPLRVAGVEDRVRRQRAGALLAAVGLDGFGDRGVRGLSGGERQRVGLARALAADPDVLLFDEPLAMVDPERRAALRDLIAELHRRRPVTTVHVTHDRVEASELGERIAVLLDGTVVQQGTAREVFEQPASVAVARFVGATNLLRGRVTGGLLATPFGPLPVAGPDGDATVAVRPEHLWLSPAGPLAAVVERVVYRAGRQRVVVVDDTGAHRLTAETDSDVAVAAGETVRLTSARAWRIPGPRQRTPDPAATGAPEDVS